jgi:cytidylate kinase
VTAPIVTLTAPHGTGGGTIGSAVAEQLGVTFLDRGIPTSVARALAIPEADALAHDERTETRIGRVLAALAASGMSYGPTPGDIGVVLTEGAYREQTERVIRDAAAGDGCVIHGRAAAIVLRDHPTALHVSLRGSLDARVRHAAATSGEGQDSIRRFYEDSDKTRSAYYRHFYGKDPDDPSLYHLVIDSIVLDSDTCTDLIVTAARARSHD